MTDNILAKLSPQILNEFPDGIVLINVKTLKIIYVNSEILNMFGYQADELLKKEVFILHPLIQESEIRNLLKSKGQQYYRDIQCVRKNGKFFYVDIAACYIKLKDDFVAVGFFREREKMKRGITSWENIYRHLSEMVNCGICLVNENKILYVNQVFTDMLGAKSSLQLIGKEVTDIVSEDVRDEFRKNYESIINGINPVLTVKRQFRKFDGTTITCFIKISRVMVRGKIATHAIICDANTEFNNNFFFNSSENKEEEKEITLLTKKEVEVLRLIALGNEIKAIGKKLNIGERTVRTHKYNIMRKLQIHCTAKLTQFAIKNKLINL